MQSSKLMKAILKQNRPIVILYRIRRLVQKLTLHQRLLFIMLLLVTITVVLVGTITYFQASAAVKRQAAILSLQQLRQASDSLERFHREVKELAVLVVSDDRVQRYLSEPFESGREGYDEVFRTLSYFQNTKQGFRYMFLHKSLTNQSVYVGPSKSGTDIDLLHENIINSRENISDATLRRLGPMEDPFTEGRWSYLLVQPVFDLFRVRNRLGTLFICISEDYLLTQYAGSQNELDMTYLIVDSNHKILSHADKTLVGTAAADFAKLNGARGEFEGNGRMIVFEYVEAWDFYLVGIIPLNVLLRDSRALIADVALVMIAVLLLAAVAAYLFSAQMTKPFSELLTCMNRVANRKWDQSLDLSRYGNDFATVSTGFNSMTLQIGELMRKVVEEERQLRKIELLALHAQIKPHFLYNTLDSIHWLAAVNQQTQIATMIKALAGFCRICLSQGKDLIALKDEFDHVRNYLIIQGFRHSEMFSAELLLPERYEWVTIPKMTLQPLVENAIYHGLRGKTEGGLILVSVSETAEALVISVADNGTGMSEAELERLNLMTAVEPRHESEESLTEYDNYGLMNVHRRLFLYYGKGYGLTFLRSGTGGVSVNIHIPAFKSGNEIIQL